MPINDNQLKSLGPWTRGVNNRTDETTVPNNFLRSAINVDLTTAGNARTRTGTTKKLSGVGAHSAWSKPGYPFGFYVTSNTLTAFDTNYHTTTIRSGLKPAQPLSYDEVNGTVFWSNGFDNGRIDLDLVDQPFGLAQPIGTPTLTAGTGEALPAGTYQVACTFQTTTGEESGSTQAALVTVAANGSITLTHIPQPTDARVSVIRIYISPPDGDLLYWLDDVPVGTTTAVIGVLPDLKKELTSQWLSPMPPGQIVRYHNARLWVASGNVVWHGSPFHYGLFRRSQEFALILPDHVTLMEPCGQADEGGMFIAAGKRTLYLSGEPKTPKQILAHPFGAVPGTGIKVPGWWFDSTLKNECAFWMDSAGMPILGTVGGGIRVLTADMKTGENYYTGPFAESGASLIRDINGMRQAMVNLRGVTVNTAAAQDELVATVHRNGVVI